MSDEQQNYKAVMDALSRQLTRLGNVLLADPASPKTIPSEVAIELQHMLVHLRAASAAVLTDYSTRIDQIGHALGHLDRAMLDACKIHIQKNMPLLSKNVNFMRAWIEVRQLECGKHFRDRSSLDVAPNEGLRIPSTSNPVCDRFYKLLEDYALLPSQTPTAGIAVSPQGDRWSAYFKELGRWFQRELLYSSLHGQKSLDALNGMLQSFWTLDVDLLRNLNKRLELDILVTNAKQAIDHGWNDDKMKQHRDFITRYTQESCSDKEIVQNYTWIRPTFTSLLEFYGQNWRD